MWKLFFQKHLIKQKDVLLNAIKLYDERSNIIKLFEDKNIKPSNYLYDAEFEPELIPKLEKYEPKEFELEKYVSEGFNLE